MQLFSQIQTILATVAFTSLPIAGFAQQLVPANHEVRAECRKTGTGGCTGHRSDICKSAPLGLMIVGRSVQFGSSGAYGIAIRCNHELKGEKVFDHWSGPIKLYEQICITSHIESGGGGRKIGTVFYNKCRANYDLVTRPVIQAKPLPNASSD